MAKKTKEPQKVPMNEINIYEAVSRWTKGRFTLDSGVYSGRPPSSSDLNFEILQAIYHGLFEEVGQEEARNFVRFVNLLSDLSASSFIVAFQAFWSSGCRNVRFVQERSHRKDLGNAKGDALQSLAFVLMGQALSGPGLDEEQIQNLSRPIKGRFLLCYGGWIPEAERSLVVVTH